MSNLENIAVIVLAAGSSSRMGAHKLLLPLGGKPLVAWSVAAACASQASTVIVALGRSAGEVAEALPEGLFTTVVNTGYADGMGTTLALAVRQLPPDVLGTLVVLGDQPLMPASAINAVLAAARKQPNRVTMGDYGGRRGHPVYLPRRVFPQVLALTGDEGARSIIAAEHGDIGLVSIVGAEHALLDVDTPEEYSRVQALLQASEKTPS